jgi:broad specificity phosphatase PhoE
MLLMAAFSPVMAQNNSLFPDGTYYLIRHAEKETGPDPKLTEAGKKRAGDLYQRLKKSPVSQIYTTSFLRTAMTGDSVRIYQRADTFYYGADTTAEGLLSALQQHFKKNSSVLIIGHSNTVPAILRKMGAGNLEGYEIPETQFNNLFIVEIKKGKVSKFLQEQYGEWTP